MAVLRLAIALICLLVLSGCGAKYKMAESKTNIAAKAQPYMGYVQKASQTYGVPQDIILAVMQTESRFDPKAHSPTGVKGLMQVTQSTYTGLGFTGDRANPENSIMAGTKLLSQNYKQYGNWNDALTAYNAGHHGVTGIKSGKWGAWTGNKGKQKEARNYAPTVMKNRTNFGGVAGADTSVPIAPSRMEPTAGDTGEDTTQQEDAYTDFQPGLPAISEAQSPFGALQPVEYTPPNIDESWFAQAEQAPVEMATLQPTDTGSDNYFQDVLEGRAPQRPQSLLGIPTFEVPEPQPTMQDMVQATGALPIVQNGQPTFAIPETPTEARELRKFDPYDEMTRGSLVNLMQMLKQAEAQKSNINKPMFSSYPTMFDDDLLQLIDEV